MRGRAEGQDRAQAHPVRCCRKRMTQLRMERRAASSGLLQRWEE